MGKRLEAGKKYTKKYLKLAETFEEKLIGYVILHYVHLMPQYQLLELMYSLCYFRVRENSFCIKGNIDLFFKQNTLNCRISIFENSGKFSFCLK